MARLLAFVAFLVLLVCCSKEQDGSVQFRARTRHSYHYYSFQAALLYSQYGNVIKQTSSMDAGQTLVLTSIPDGNYYWTCMISYDSANVLRGNRSFGGNVVVEKGKRNDILIEVD